MRTLRFFVLFVGLHPVISLAQQRIAPVQAKDYVGQVATVCGKVAGVHQAMRSRGEPTFINLDRAYPNQIFTILIWGNDRPRFGNLERDYMDKSLCVTGAISSYRGVPEIITRSPGSIKLGQRDGTSMGYHIDAGEAALGFPVSSAAMQAQLRRGRGASRGQPRSGPQQKACCSIPGVTPNTRNSYRDRPRNRIATLDRPHSRFIGPRTPVTLATGSSATNRAVEPSAVQTTSMAGKKAE